MTCPITQAQIRNLRTAITQFQQARDEIETAKKAGIDVEQECEQCETLLAAATQIVNTYGPMLDTARSKS